MVGTSQELRCHRIINPWNGLGWLGPSHSNPCHGQGHHGASLAAAHPACKLLAFFTDLPEFGSLGTKDAFPTEMPV